MKLFVIAGEPSGDALGAALIAGLRQLVPDLTLAGVGGPLMQAQGLSSLFPMEELSVMGLAEVLPKYFPLKRRIKETAQAIADQAPDAVITIDSPDFCLRVLAIAKPLNPALKTIHYVAPSVWAWRPKRATKMARWVDHVLALLPFEPPYMQAAGMSCDFTGHPVTTEPVATEAEAATFRTTHGIAATAPLLLVLPGSRKGEVERLGPLFGTTLKQVHQPGLRVVIPSVAARADQVRALVADWPGDPLVLDAASTPPATKRAAFRAADAALAASGTVSLELAAAGTPMVIAYRMNALSQAIIARMLRIDTVTLVNLVSDTRAVPEFIGPRCDPARIAPAVQALLNPGPARDAQVAAMALTMARLGRGGAAPGLRAARSVLSVIHGR
ncbi:lipid-A-disaccharide synthase [Pararhodobacter zhoushanensis]|uniref:Lipid-A-disaccharide synthase n=1 Tax=Pararhodobacter zhoushanensis TaxID=2479545 RepID=A0ABT3GZ19_9RHOB|nr:lipid-A-disaccharide synthase [Pararhodobacter zhoushanensis]MCW1932782.1 lipid-A-disaccharide synthase [Pararhodobacter zhoushanensis]